MTWTHFWDMHSGGGTKENPYNHIYIELPKEKAIDHFEERFGHHPERITCDCCGEDYSISQYETLEEATSFQRGESSWRSKPVMPLEQYIAEGGSDDGKALIIRSAEIAE